MRRSDVLLFVMILIWGANFAVIKIALESFQPLSFNAIRFIVASALLIVATRGRGGNKKLERTDLIHLVILGALANCAYQVAFISGMNLTRAGNAALILAVTPVFTSLLSAWRGHERLGTRSLIGMAASFLGVILIVLGSGEAIDFKGSLAGDLLVFSCTLLWPIYSVGLQPFIIKYGPMTCTRITMIAGTIPLVIISLPSLLRQSWSTVTLAGWGGLFFSAAGAIALCYSIWNYSVRRVGNTRTSAYSNLTPVVALSVAWLFLGERPLVGQLVGMGVIFIGIYFTRTGRKREELGGAGA